MTWQLQEFIAIIVSFGISVPLNMALAEQIRTSWHKDWRSVLVLSSLEIIWWASVLVFGAPEFVFLCAILIAVSLVFFIYGLLISGKGNRRAPFLERLLNGGGKFFEKLFEFLDKNP